jgi:uroporphyrinogen decarboxylase
MHTRRTFLAALGASALPAAPLSHIDRVRRALDGRDLDRPPYTYWYHFLDEKLPGERHAASTLEFHRKFSTDLVKVMSDYPFGSDPANPFPEQVKALRMIGRELKGKALFIETIFQPFNQAEKTSSPERVKELLRDKPQALLDRLEQIARAEAAHARLALQAGASGIFLAVSNANDGYLTREEYRKFSEPFDRMVIDAAQGAELNVLHLHGAKVYLDLFYSWPVRVIQHSVAATGVSLAAVRRSYSGVLMGGVDEIRFKDLTPEQMRRQVAAARREAGPRWILAPGCSVPNDTPDRQLLAFNQAVADVTRDKSR